MPQLLSLQLALNTDKSVSRINFFILGGTRAPLANLYECATCERQFAVEIGDYAAPLERNCRAYGNRAVPLLSEYLGRIPTEKAVRREGLT